MTLCSIICSCRCQAQPGRAGATLRKPSVQAAGLKQEVLCFALQIFHHSACRHQQPPAPLKSTHEKYTRTHIRLIWCSGISVTLWVFCNRSFLLVHLTHFILRRPCALCSLHLRIRNCSDSDFYAWIRTLQGTVILKSQIQVGQSQLPAADWVL